MVQLFRTGGTLVKKASAIATRIVVSLFLITLCGCLTPGKREPEWITSFPSYPGYYVGIGSSNTGSRAADMEAARLKALADLAGSISTQIRSEQDFVTRDTGDGDTTTIAEVVIGESVSQHLSQVETVDSYYSEELGYWFMLRLNRTLWEQIQAEEMQRLSDRVTSLLSNADLDQNADVSTADRIVALEKAWNLLAQSPFAGFINGELGGRRGLLLDLVESELRSRIDGLWIEFDPQALVAEYGRPAAIEFQVITSDGSPAGVLEVDLVSPEAVLTTLDTDETGRFSGEIDLSGFAPGKSQLKAIIALDRLSVASSGIPGGLKSPVAVLPVDVRQIRAGLDVSADENLEIANLEGAVQSILSRISALKLGKPSPEDRFAVTFELSVRDAPKSDFTEGLMFVFLQAVVTVSSGESVVMSYQTEEYKGGGLDRAQAQDSAFDDLTESLAGDSELARRFNDVMALE